MFFGDISERSQSPVSSQSHRLFASIYMSHKMYAGSKTDIKCSQEQYDTNNLETFDIGLKNHTNVRKCCTTFPELFALGMIDFKDDYKTRYA
jgi:hypothetical protein